MAALVGKTMISVVGEGPFGDLGDLVSVGQPTSLESGSTGRSSFWIAWRCADQPGIAAAVVSEFEKYLRESECDDLAIEYAVTRALQDGETSAGKLRIAGSGESVRRMFEEGGPARLESSLRVALGSALTDWHPPYGTWLDSPVQVRDFEPSEEPWATLALRAGAS